MALYEKKTRKKLLSGLLDDFCLYSPMVDVENHILLSWLICFLLLQHPVLIEKLAAMRKFIKEEISRHRKTFNLHSPYDLIDLYIESKKKGADISGM